MGLFIVLSTPTSGVVPVAMLPVFFQHVHAVMPLGNAVDALRGVLYFHGAGCSDPSSSCARGSPQASDS
ncbi:hypothetical protein [Streptomyces sp. NPDC002265]|uniref:hypothetical protein n=1 Tax=Streptomyces sp. NPDC002265 TaxID=3154415 RepID=UPI00331DC697